MDSIDTGFLYNREILAVRCHFSPIMAIFLISPMKQRLRASRSNESRKTKVKLRTSA